MGRHTQSIRYPYDATTLVIVALSNVAERVYPLIDQPELVRKEPLYAHGVDDLAIALRSVIDQNVVNALGMRFVIGEILGHVRRERRVFPAGIVTPSLDAPSLAVVPEMKG